MFRKRRELETFSLALDKMINGADLQASLQYRDELPSKIRHQFLQLERMIRENEKQREKERDEIRGLIAEIAHQMRNPLANIGNYLELLEAAGCESERREYLDALKSTQAQLHFLTESFIKMARLESRIIQIKPDASALCTTIAQSILQVKKAADAKGIIVELTADMALEVSHDANWLGEAVYNILENSVKYSPRDSVIQVSAVRNEMYTRISVSDSGIGIAEGEEAQIFQRFYRGKETKGQPGFGLGLYLAREIVLLHGGFVKARRRDPGLEILIFLP